MLLIDGDIVAYRCAWTTQDTTKTLVKSTVDNYLYELITQAYTKIGSEGDATVYLTGKDNFRHDVAVSHPYKGNRKQEKPKHLELIRQHLISSWDAVLADKEEADDAIAIAATANPDAVIVSVDKDFLQVPGRFYNMTKGDLITVTELEGTRHFYKQVLTGDRVDNIVGLYGIGPKKADAIIDPLTDEIDMYNTCVKMYAERDMGEERVIENARLLWLRRYENQEWQPPTSQNNESTTKDATNKEERT